MKQMKDQCQIEHFVEFHPEARRRQWASVVRVLMLQAQQFCQKLESERGGGGKAKAETCEEGDEPVSTAH